MFVGHSAAAGSPDPVRPPGSPGHELEWRLEKQGNFQSQERGTFSLVILSLDFLLEPSRERVTIKTTGH